jgi:AcrR family transcriptional regulator
MGPLDAPAGKLGLRERKKQQTRETIARVALELFAERGYDETTLADIAEAADVSPRTIFAYYESKEDILFCGGPSLEELSQALDQRLPGTTTVDAIREYLGSLPPPDEETILRKKVIMTTPSVQVRHRARHAALEPVLTRSIARDLGAARADDLRARLAAASVLAAFETALERLEANPDQPVTHEEAMAILDHVLDFTRAGVEALQRD